MMLAFGLLPWLFLHLRHAPVEKQEQLPLSTPSNSSSPVTPNDLSLAWQSPISGEPLIQCKDPALESVSCQHVDHCLSVALQHSPGPDMVDGSSRTQQRYNQLSNPVLASPSPASPLMKSFSQSSSAQSVSPTVIPHLYADYLHLPGL